MERDGKTLTVFSNLSCEAKNSIALIDGKIYEITNGEWSKMKASRRARAIMNNLTFNLQIDRSEKYVSNLHDQEHNVFKLFDELSGFMQSEGASTVTDVVTSVRKLIQTPEMFSWWYDILWIILGITFTIIIVYVVIHFKLSIQIWNFVKGTRCFSPPSKNFRVQCNLPQSSIRITQLDDTADSAV